MKKRLAALILILILQGLGAQEINWISDYDSAKDKAGETGQNILVLITAPSWCTYCQWMAENTLQDPEVIELLNQGFVPAFITDENPQVERFNFDGYPTVQIFSPQGDLLKEASGAIASEPFMNILSPFSIEAAENTGGDNPVRLYGRDSSQRTADLIEYFSSQGIEYEFHNVDIPEEKQEIRQAIEAYGFKGTIFLPIIIINGQIFFPPS